MCAKPISFFLFLCLKCESYCILYNCIFTFKKSWKIFILGFYFCLYLFLILTHRYEPILLLISAYGVSSPTRHCNSLWFCNSMISTLSINRSVSNSDLYSKNFILIIVRMNLSIDSEGFSVKLLFVISKYLPCWNIYIYVCIQLRWVFIAFSWLSPVAESKGYYRCIVQASQCGGFSFVEHWL